MDHSVSSVASIASASGAATSSSASASTSAAAGASSGSTSGASAASLDYEAFLQLLIAQLQNQDPTEPMDSTAYMAQLASFSNVEQAVQTNAKLDGLMSSLALSQADGVIGRTVTSGDGSVSGEVASLRVVSGGAVAVLTNGRELPLGPGVTVSGSADE